MKFSKLLIVIFLSLGSIQSKAGPVDWLVSRIQSLMLNENKLKLEAAVAVEKALLPPGEWQEKHTRGGFIFRGISDRRLTQIVSDGTLGVGFDSQKLRGGFYTNWVGDASGYLRGNQYTRGAVLVVPVNPSSGIRVVDYYSVMRLPEVRAYLDVYLKKKKDQLEGRNEAYLFLNREFGIDVALDTASSMYREAIDVTGVNTHSIILSAKALESVVSTAEDLANNIVRAIRANANLDRMGQRSKGFLTSEFRTYLKELIHLNSKFPDCCKSQLIEAEHLVSAKFFLQMNKSLTRLQSENKDLKPFLNVFKDLLYALGKLKAWHPSIEPHREEIIEYFNQKLDGKHPQGEAEIAEIVAELELAVDSTRSCRAFFN